MVTPRLAGAKLAQPTFAPQAHLLVASMLPVAARATPTANKERSHAKRRVHALSVAF